MKRKKFLHRVAAVLCALVVAVSSLGLSDSYAAADGYTFEEFVEDCGLPFPTKLPEDCYYLVVGDSDFFSVTCIPYDTLPTFYLKFDDSANDFRIYVSFANPPSGYSVYRCWYSYGSSKWSYYGNVAMNTANELYSISVGLGNKVYMNELMSAYIPFPVLDYVSGEVAYSQLICVNGVIQGGENFSSSLGYLQNVTRTDEYLRGDYTYYYDDESLKRVWKHDLTSTTGVDLSSGYKIRHYVAKATVTGYGKDEIVEMTDKYLMGEYDASAGRFEYLQKDYDSKLEDMGYDGLGFIDKYLKGYFVLEHHYFQLVNTSTNEVGNYLHIYPKDKDTIGSDWEELADGTVDMEQEGIDQDGNIDETGPSGEIGTSVGAGSSYEDAEQNASEPKLGDFQGVDEFSGVVKAVSSDVGNVSSAVGAIFGMLPSWVLLLFSLSVGMAVLLFIIKIARN